MATTSSSKRTQLVIVALPSENDYVRKISSEPVPHLTLLYLGEPDYDGSQLAQIEDYVGYASTLLSQFTLEVERRGLLGDKDADVLFFYKDYTSKAISTFREHLLQDPLISAAYNAEDQFDGWTPHLTLGYPETPAKSDPNDHDREVTFVKFDRVALWIGDHEGPTYELKPYSYDMEVAMSQIKSPSSVMREVGVSLQHYGVKGMKWGVRRADPQPTQAAPAQKPLPISADVKSAVNAQRKIAAGGTQALSNQELQGLLTRMNLERQYRTMVSSPPQKSAMDKGHDQVKKYLAYGETYEKARKFMASDTGKAIKTGLAGALAAAAAYATGGTSAAVTAGAGAVIRRATR
jgi:2'-5' RNA ligase